MFSLLWKGTGPGDLDPKPNTVVVGFASPKPQKTKPAAGIQLSLEKHVNPRRTVTRDILKLETTSLQPEAPEQPLFLLLLSGV